MLKGRNNESAENQKHLPDNCHVVFDRNADSICVVGDDQFPSDRSFIPGTSFNDYFHVSKRHLGGVQEKIFVEYRG